MKRYYFGIVLPAAGKRAFSREISGLVSGQKYGFCFLAAYYFDKAAARSFLVIPVKEESGPRHVKAPELCHASHCRHGEKCEASTKKNASGMLDLLIGSLETTSLQSTLGLCAGVALEFLPPVAAARLLIKINN